MKWIYSPPNLIKKIFSNFIWESKSDKILLTFDDGPNPQTTELILKSLRDRNVKGLFFCVGDNVMKYESLTKEILDEGHEIGNHTFNHKSLFCLPKKEVNEQIQKVNLDFQNKFGKELKYFRPPFGKIDLNTNAIAKQNSLQTVMWTLITYDFKNDFHKVKFSVNNFLTKNTIVVLHDNIKCKSIIVDSINYVIDNAEKKDYKFGDARECLSMN